MPVRVSTDLSTQAGHTAAVPAVHTSQPEGGAHLLFIEAQVGPVAVLHGVQIEWPGHLSPGNDWEAHL